jgi:hypothetical protein
VSTKLLSHNCFHTVSFHACKQTIQVYRYQILKLYGTKYPDVHMYTIPLWYKTNKNTLSIERVRGLVKLPFKTYVKWVYLFLVSSLLCMNCGFDYDRNSFYLDLVLANFFKPITDEDFSNFQVTNLNRTDFN